jgi:hypothetical protein
MFPAPSGVDALQLYNPLFVSLLIKKDSKNMLALKLIRLFN